MFLKFLRRGRRDDDAAREIASYIAIETDDNIARGMAPQAAHDAAVRKFGNATRVREEIYWMNTIRPIDMLWQDLRYAMRLLVRDKGFAAAAIISLALGIGANTAIFQLLDAVRLRTLPVSAPEQLVEVRFRPGTSRSGSFTGRRPMLTYPLFDEIRRRQNVFTGMFAWNSAPLNTAAGGEVRRIEGLWTSGEMWGVLGLKPLIGRFYTPEEDRPGCGSPGAVLSHAYWQREFGGAPSVLQQTVRLNGVTFDIIGVAPQDFFGLDVGRRFDVALPLCGERLTINGESRETLRNNWWLAAIGRLTPGPHRAAGDRSSRVDLSRDHGGDAADRVHAGRGEAVSREQADGDAGLVRRLHHSRAVWRAPRRAARGDRSRAVDRVRQPREPAARARQRTRARDGGAPGHWCATPAPRHAAAGRKRLAGGDRDRCWASWLREA